jgi:uridine kinase
VLREARVNQIIEDGFYPGLEAAIDEYDVEPDEDEHDQLDLSLKKQTLANMKNPALMKPPKPNGGVSSGKPRG